MRSIFIADAHLGLPEEPNYRLLLRFLHELTGQVDELFILGDLFDFWLGFPDNPFRQHDPLIEALQALRDGGCRLVYFEGNHDFHLGPVFTGRLSAEVHGGPALLTVQGRRLFLCHGDQINSGDHGYRLLRFLLHNPLTAGLVKIVPPALALMVKERLQRRSRASYHAKTMRWDYRRIIREFAGSVEQRGCEGLVTGHFHLALKEFLPGSRFTILALGDWMRLFTYGEMIDGELNLRTYPSGVCASEGDTAPQPISGTLPLPDARKTPAAPAPPPERT